MPSIPGKQRRLLVFCNHTKRFNHRLFQPNCYNKIQALYCSSLNHHVSDLLLQLSPIIPCSNLTPQYTSFPPINRKYKLPTFLNLLGLQTYHLLLDRLLPIITSGVLSIAGVFYDIHTYRHKHLLSISGQGQCQCATVIKESFNIYIYKVYSKNNDTHYQYITKNLYYFVWKHASNDRLSLK